MSNTYNPSAWFWIVGGDGSQVYSSSSISFIPTDNFTYQSWLNSGGVPTRVDTLENLGAVLGLAGIPPFKPITPLQARLALRQIGLLDQVNSLVAASTIATVPDIWAYASEIDRNNPIVLSLAQQLSLSSSQIDSIFILAASLT